jgi:hypothetical protein
MTTEVVSRKYVRAAGLIRARIADGTLRPGEPVPSGAALARVTGYSAPTCRHALRTLVEDGTLAPGPSANARPRVPVPASSSARQALSEATRALSSGLASRRRAAGLTQPALAALLGLSVTAVGHAETGRLWQSRDFWENADKVLAADGELLSLHDAWRAANAPVAAGNAGGQAETSGPLPNRSGMSSSPAGPAEVPGTGELRKLSDPEFFTRWAAVRNLLFGTPSYKPEYREVKHLYGAVSAEYRRRTGGLAVTNMDLLEGVIVEENENSGQVIYKFERTYFEKLRLAAQVILDAASDLSLVSDPLEVELGIFKDRVEFMLLLPEYAQEARTEGEDE